MTRLELLGELKKIQIARVDNASNTQLLKDQLEVERKLAMKEYDRILQPTKQQKIVHRVSPPLFVDTYVGPRCDFCSGPKPEATCLNNGPAWPHPPGV